MAQVTGWALLVINTIPAGELCILMKQTVINLGYDGFSSLSSGGSRFDFGVDWCMGPRFQPGELAFGAWRFELQLQRWRRTCSNGLPGDTTIGKLEQTG